jgi:hypothetical protein
MLMVDENEYVALLDLYSWEKIQYLGWGKEKKSYSLHHKFLLWNRTQASDVRSW